MTGAPLDVVGIGSMVVDRVHRAPRLLGPDEKGILRGLEGAEPVRAFAGGVVLNHLGWAATLGLRVGIFGRQADDENGRFLRAAMNRLGIERDIAIDASASSMAEIFVDDAGERSIYMAPGATGETTALHVGAHADFVRRGRRLTTEVSQLPLPAVLAALELAGETGIPTVVDLDVPPSDALASGLGDESMLEIVLARADLLKPSKGAGRELAPGCAEPLALARSLRERFGNRAVVVTDGEAGCAIAALDFEGFVPARPVKAVDTTGAGDAFLGGMLVALSHKLGWETAARLANACGAACVEQLGALPDDPARARARVLELYSGPKLELAPFPGRAAAEAVLGAAEAVASFGIAVEELAALRDRLDAEAFEAALRLLARARERGGRVHVTGIGKPEHIARYAASLLSSTGTPTTFLHGTEAVHGSAGQVLEGDVVIAVSNRGESVELHATLAAVRAMGTSVIAVTGAPDSRLGRDADVVLDAGVAREGGPLGFAPRASAAAELLVLAALAAGAERATGFSREEYHRRHPAGALGKLSGPSS